VRRPIAMRGRRLDGRAELLGPRAVAGRLLPAVPDRRCARRQPAGGGPAVRHRGGRIPARAFAQSRPAAVVSHARVRAHRLAAGDLGFSRALDGPRTVLAQELGLPFAIDVANDPFFGRVGQVMAVSQRQQALKFELLVPYHATATPTACMSFNYHREHFGNVWGIYDDQGEKAHTSCVAFGIDRLAVALFAVHGLDVARWPAGTRQALVL
jgi:hypothetical protein